MAGASDVRAGRAFIEFGIDGIEAAKAKMENFANAFQTLGTALALGFATDKIMSWVDSFAQGGREMVNMSRQLSISIADLQEASSVAKELGIDADSMTAAIHRSRIFIAEMGLAGEQTNEVMHQLGLTLSDVVNLSDLARVQKFGEALSRLNRDQADLISRQVFGRGGIALGAVAGRIGEARDSARGSWILSEAQVHEANELAKAMESLNGNIANVYKAVAVHLAPAFTGVYNAISEIVKTVRVWVSDNAELVQKIVMVGGAFAATGTAIVAIAAGAELIKMSFGAIIGNVWGVASALLGVVGMVFTPFGLVLASATAILGVLGAWPGIINSFVSGFSRVAEIFGESFGAIKDALEAGELKLAFEIAIAGLKILWIDFNQWFKEKFGVTCVDMFAGMKAGFVGASSFIETEWARLTKELTIGGNTIGTAIGNALTLMQAMSGEISFDVAAASIAQANAENEAANRAIENETRNRIGNIEADRRAALGQVENDRVAGNRGLDRSQAERDLENLQREAETRAAAADGARSRALESINPDLEAIRGGGSSGTFNASALFGFGAQSPMARLENIGEQQVRILEQIETLLEAIDPAVG